MSNTRQIRDQEVRQAAEVIENAEAYGPFVFTSSPTPSVIRYAFRDRTFFGSEELLAEAAVITIRRIVNEW